MSDLQTAKELAERADQMPEGPQRIAAYEEAIRMVDALGEADIAYDIRQKLVFAGIFTGYPARAIVAFSWCLAHFDENPQKYDERQILWRLKWILGNVAQYSTISKDQITGIYDDTERRYRNAGYSLRPLYGYLMGIQYSTGLVEQIESTFKRYQSALRDDLADCLACELDFEVWYYAFMGDDQTAVRKAVQLIEGNHSCKSVPKRTYGKTFRPLIRLGRSEEAMKYYTVGIKHYLKSAEYPVSIVQSLVLLTRMKEFAKAVRVLEKAAALSTEGGSQQDHLQLYAASGLMLSRMSRTKPSCKLRLPMKIGCFQRSGEYNTSDLAEWFNDHASKLVSAFNQRNGNEAWSQYLSKNQEFVG